jgi:hypothetical protein
MTVGIGVASPVSASLSAPNGANVGGNSLTGAKSEFSPSLRRSSQPVNPIIRVSITSTDSTFQDFNMSSLLYHQPFNQ